MHPNTILVCILNVVIFSFLSGCTRIDMLASTSSVTNPSYDEPQVQIHGDSVFDLSGEIQKQLQQLSGKFYKEVSASGAKAEEIRAGFNALSETERNSIKTLIIDGGANNMLKTGNSRYDVTYPGFNPIAADIRCADNPLELSTECNANFTLAINNVTGFLSDIAQAGVEHVIILGYPTPQAPVSDLKLAVDTLNSGLKNACDSSQNVDCHFIDTSLQPGQDPVPYQKEVNADGLHPSLIGSQVRAQLIWDKLVEINAYR